MATTTKFLNVFKRKVKNLCHIFPLFKKKKKKMLELVAEFETI